MGQRCKRNLDTTLDLALDSKDIHFKNQDKEKVLKLQKDIDTYLAIELDVDADVDVDVNIGLSLDIALDRDTDENR